MRPLLQTLVALVASPVTGYTDSSNKSNTCPAITGLQLSACNTDCGRVEAKFLVMHNKGIQASRIQEANDNFYWVLSQVSLAGSDWKGVCSSTWTGKEASVVCRNWLFL